MKTSKPKKVVIRKRGYPSIDMSQHKTGDELIQHIRQFNKDRHFVPGALYHIGGKEVRI